MRIIEKLCPHCQTYSRIIYNDDTGTEFKNLCRCCARERLINLGFALFIFILFISLIFFFGRKSNASDNYAPAAIYAKVTGNQVNTDCIRKR